jgi:hypothetical protein
METNRKKRKPKQKAIENIIYFYNDFRNHLLNNNGYIKTVDLTKLYKKYSLAPTTLKALLNLKIITKTAPSTFLYNLDIFSNKIALRVLTTRNKIHKDYLDKRKQSAPVKKSKPVKIRTEPRTYIKKKKPSLFRRLINFIFGK